ncbi:hypothetical protein [Carboxylicivirga linearis]|uniref:Glycoside hydrolase family 65 n=1 Tax=Carboxylicivirga linearis TaxID=1628157 RepID=A0ABS5JR79_9BACT|nr:hypothetical protein [Carboxylicivirga linearis]MBS2097408.1 hypothetical protein [Carboxylicivirga linearis]
MKYHIFLFLLCISFCFACNKSNESIDRYSLVARHNPSIRQFDSLASLSVGNGNFAFTVDATGLQTFPEYYKNGVPLGTQSQWGWHSFPNPEEYKIEETFKVYNFRGKDELYAAQFNEDGRPKRAANWYRANPHRLHLGYIGFDIDSTMLQKDITDVNQQLDLWKGIINSVFNLKGQKVSVSTACDPQEDKIEARVVSDLLAQNQLKISFKFPYPTGKHADYATDWKQTDKHETSIVAKGDGFCVLQRKLDNTVYYLNINWKGEAQVLEKGAHYYVLESKQEELTFSCEFLNDLPENNTSNGENIFELSSDYWQSFWMNGGAVDFSRCTDERAFELERRVVLSQYLMAIQCAGNLPPQETGLTYNSWFGKFHLEMHWWHAVHFALWNRTDLLERSLDWYNQAYDNAKSIAERQGFDGVRWMKMTDPSSIEAPSKVGSFLIWQQPHFIYFAELVYRNNPSDEVLAKYKDLVKATAEFMYSFADYDSINSRYILKGIIPAQETLRARETVNPPFELAYWHLGMSIAQQWLERTGEGRNPQWDKMIEELSPLTALGGLYLASEDAVDTYKDIRFTSDHPAVLGALGMLPDNDLIEQELMKNTLNWILANWNWDHTWGWDYPMTAMSAARLGEAQKAVDALLMDKRTNTYLVNGHNYQDERLRVYLPGNGGLLTAVAMMCAGWDNNTVDTPGFPKDGSWNVVWEDLAKMP